MLPVLQAIIDASSTGDLTFLMTDQRKPFTPAGFGGWFRERCDEAGLQHCSAHGLRKAGASIAAENGASPHQLMAIFGWLTLKSGIRRLPDGGGWRETAWRSYYGKRRTTN